MFSLALALALALAITSPWPSPSRPLALSLSRALALSLLLSLLLLCFPFENLSEKAARKPGFARLPSPIRLRRLRGSSQPSVRGAGGWEAPRVGDAPGAVRAGGAPVRAGWDRWVAGRAGRAPGAPGAVLLRMMRSSKLEDSLGGSQTGAQISTGLTEQDIFETEDWPSW